MIKCGDLARIFKKNDLTYFAGVPDSIFKDWMKYLGDNKEKEIINRVTVIERDAIAWAAGYYVSTGKVPIVYMQNSGLGNVVNPITSLSDPEVYSIPTILMIGWRGEPEKKDEPQHKKMGRVMLPLLNTLEIPYQILSDNPQEVENVIVKMKQLALKEGKPTALIIKKGIFEEYTPINKTKIDYEMSREEAIKMIAGNLRELEAIVSTTGKTSRELFEYREEKNFGHQNDFLMVGSMGAAASMATEIALQTTNKKVFVFDGDGAVLMSMGSLVTIGHYKPENLYHIVFDNHAYDSTGGQPTFSEDLSLEQVALASGYTKAITVKTKKGLEKEIKEIKNFPGPQMLIVKTKKGARKDLGRPTTTPIENKKVFMEFLKK